MHIHPSQPVLTIDNCSLSYATLVTGYNSECAVLTLSLGPLYSPFSAIMPKLRGTTVKSNPSVFNLLNNWNQAASFVCSAVLPPPLPIFLIQRQRKPALQFPAPIDVGRWILREPDEEICARS